MRLFLISSFCLIIISNVFGQNEKFGCRTFVNISREDINIYFQRDSFPIQPVKIDLKKLFSFSNTELDKLIIFSTKTDDLKFKLIGNYLEIEVLDRSNKSLFDTLRLISSTDTSKVNIRLFSSEVEFEIENPEIVRNEIKVHLQTLDTEDFLVVFTNNKPLYRYIYWKINSKIIDVILILGDPENYNSYSIRRKRCWRR